MYELILASQSPRRRMLLNEAGFVFRVGTVKVSENIDENLNLDEALEAVARTKAEAYLQAHKDLESQKILILSADTTVVVGKRVLGKPKDFVQAADFLRSLSATTHIVMTSVCLLNAHSGESMTFVESTEIDFHKLSDAVIEAYVQTGEPMDKAGAYAIQGEGAKLVKGYRGSWSNVVGLPMERLEETLSKKGWHVSRQSIADSE